MSKKIQSLLIDHLLKHGNIELLLPDGMALEIGINQEDNDGELVNRDEYSWVIATRKDHSVVAIDSYNLGLRFNDDKTKIVFEDSFIGEDGEPIRRLDVV